MNQFFSINLVELGLFILGLGYIFTFWRQGGNQAGNEVIAAYKEQVALNAEKITTLTHEVGVLTGQLKEKEERIILLEAIVQGRNPEQVQYMGDMRKFTAGVADYMANTIKTLGEISVFMHQLNNPELKISS